MVVYQPVEQLPVDCRRAACAGAPPPPEPVAVHLMVRAPKDRNMGGLQLLEVCRDDIHLGAPALVEPGPGCRQFRPLLVAELALDAVVKAHRLVVDRPHRVPAQGDYRPAFILAFDESDVARPRGDRVDVPRCGEPEVLAEDAGRLAA